MKYTQRDICRLLDITRETLRFYEKEQLIRPKIDPANNYRLYDDYQMYLTAEIKRYQANGFSIQEIHQMLDEDSLSDYTDRMKEKQKEYRKLAERYFWMNEFNSDYVERLEKIHDELNVIHAGFIEDLYFARQKKGSRLSLFEEEAEASRWMMKHLDFSFMMAYYPDYHAEEFEWGFGIWKWMIGEEDLPSGLQHIPSSAAVQCIACSKGQWNFSNELKEQLASYAKQRHYVPSGTLILKQLVRTKEADGERQWLEAAMPVKEKPNYRSGSDMM